MIKSNTEHAGVANRYVVARVSTVSFFIMTQLRDQIICTADSNFSVAVMCSKGEGVSQLSKIDNIEYFPVEIPREISLFKDIVAIYKLYLLFKINKVHIMHSTTPKAGLLCAVAGMLARVPVRIHTYTGQVWVTKTGLKKIVAKLADKLISKLNTMCYADSKSQVSFLVDAQVVNKNKIGLVAEGSLAGVDLNRFCVEKYTVKDRLELRKELNIPEEAKIILFVGRLAKDKGVFDLLKAFEKLHKLNNARAVFLLFVGPFEVSLDELKASVSSPELFDHIRFTGHSDCPEKYMSLASFLCLPSYREGFGTVVIEAAAMSLPTVGNNIYGLSDAIVDGETGLLVPPGDCDLLFLAIKKLIDHELLCLNLGKNARLRAEKCYDSHFVNKCVLNEYKRLMSGLL
ncbi:MAG: glycosyltransferase [Iodobacter sp.]